MREIVGVKQVYLLFGSNLDQDSTIFALACDFTVVEVSWPFMTADMEVSLPHSGWLYICLCRTL